MIVTRIKDANSESTMNNKTRTVRCSDEKKKRRYGNDEGQDAVEKCILAMTTKVDI